MADRVIVDGYNVLNAHPTYRSVAATDIDAARERLVSDLAGYAAVGHRVTVVFDAAENPGSDGSPHHIGPLSVIFSAAGTDADTVIEALASRARERGESTVVVTADREVRAAVTGGSVAWRSAAGFVEDMLGDLRSSLASHGGTESRVSVDKRLPEAVRERLARWARGEMPEAR